MSKAPCVSREIRLARSISPKVSGLTSTGAIPAWALIRAVSLSSLKVVRRRSIRRISVTPASIRSQAHDSSSATTVSSKWLPINFIARLKACSLFFIFIDGLLYLPAENGRVPAGIALPLSQDLAFSRQQERQRKLSLWIVAVRQPVVGLLLVLWQLILLHPRKVGVYQHQRGVGHRRKDGCVKYLLAQQDAGSAPVAPGKIQEDMPMLFPGNLPRFLHTAVPLRRGREIQGQE